MPRLYLRQIAEPHGWTDLGTYASADPFPAPAGFAWAEGEPTGQPYQPTPPLKDRLFTVFAGAVQQYGSLLTPAQRRGLYELQAVADKCLELGDLEALADTIQAATLPAELEPVRTALLDLVAQA